MTNDRQGHSKNSVGYVCNVAGRSRTVVYIIRGYTSRASTTKTGSSLQTTVFTIFCLWRNSLTRAYDASFLRFRDHTELDTPHSVGLLWTRDQPDAETST
jgi:hypothetical protein